MKNGKKKNSAAPLPAETPKATPTKRKAEPLSAFVAEDRKSIQRLDPAPQPSAKLKKKKSKKKAVRKNSEPAPQPLTVARRRASEKTARKRLLGGLVKRRGLESEGDFSHAQPDDIGEPYPTARGSRERSPSPVVERPDQLTELDSARERSMARIGYGIAAPSTETHQSVPGPSTPKSRGSRQPRPVPVEIPPILLEPDHTPTEPAIAGPGIRFALTPVEHPAASAPDELPESYGTEQIFLAVRDPYCLFASWDLDARQRVRYNAASASGALTIRLRRGFVEGPIHLEVHTVANSRDRFIEVAQPDTTFVAELGYHEKNSGLWRRISVSKPVTTPRDRVAPLPSAPPIIQTPAVVQTSAAVEGARARHPSSAMGPARSIGPENPHEPVFELQPQRHEIVFAIQQPPPEPRWFAKQDPEPFRERPRWEPPKEKPRWTPPKRVPAPRWSPSKTKQLDELISLEFRRMQQGSIEIEELLRRRILRSEEEKAPSSLEWQELAPEEMLAEALGLAQPQPPSSMEVAATAVEAPKGFWFRVNAELIIYGSTEPDARVSIGGRPIRLRSDGSFSYRFALPDGAYELPVIAIGRDGHDGRSADLRFSRATVYSGEVGKHPQDPALKTPSPANL
jgi:hypothetical protein